MKLLPLFVVCLAVAAVCNLALDFSQWTRFRALTQAVGPMIGDVGGGEHPFDEQLTGTDDPGELRKIARTQHVRREDADHLALALLGSVNRMNGMATVRSGVLLALALGTLGLALRRPQRAQQGGRGA